MPAWVLLTFVGHIADVIRVPQNAGQAAVRQRTRCAFRTGPRHQSARSQGIADALNGVAVGIQLECLLDQRAAYRVNLNSVDLAALNLDGHILVAQRRRAKGAAVLGFLPHLVGDVLAVLLGAELVHRGQDALHELSLRAVVNRFGCGHERDAASSELVHDQSLINAVARQPGQLVHDDVGDVLVPFDTVQQLLELHEAGHLATRHTCLDVFADYCQAELVGLVLAGFALCWQADVFRIVVGCHLFRVGDP